MSHGTVGIVTFKKWLDRFVYGYIDIPAVHLLPTYCKMYMQCRHPINNDNQ